MCQTEQELFETYDEVLEMLADGIEADAGTRACECLDTYVRGGNLRERLEAWVGLEGDAESAEALLAFDPEMLASLGLNPIHAQRLHQTVDEQLGLLVAGGDDLGTWTQGRVDDTMAAIEQLVDRVCAAADVLARDDASWRSRRRAVAWITFGITTVTAIAVAVATGDYGTVLAIDLVASGLLLSLEYLPWPDEA